MRALPIALLIALLLTSCVSIGNQKVETSLEDPINGHDWIAWTRGMKEFYLSSLQQGALYIQWVLVEVRWLPAVMNSYFLLIPLEETITALDKFYTQEVKEFNILDVSIIEALYLFERWAREAADE